MAIDTNVNAMQAHESWINNSAHNVANVNTKDFKAIDTTIQNNGIDGVQAIAMEGEYNTDIADEMIDQIVIEDTQEFNADSIRTQDEMMGTLLDMKE